MKKNLILTFLFFTALSTFVQAQANQTHTNLPIDSRLYEAFDSLYLENVKTGNPFLLHRWNFYLDHSWYSTVFPPEKMKADYPRVRIDDLSNINIFLLEGELKLRRDWNQPMVYKIENSEKFLIFRSGQEFTDLLKKYLKHK